MYVEERLAQLENITNEHGKQIEMVADGLATLTTRESFGKVDQRFERLEGRVDRIEVKLEEHDARFERIEVKLAEHDARFERIEQRLDRVEYRLDRLEEQVIQIHTVLTELVTLVKNKL